MNLLSLHYQKVGKNFPGGCLRVRPLNLYLDILISQATQAVKPLRKAILSCLFVHGCFLLALCLLIEQALMKPCAKQG